MSDVKYVGIDVHQASSVIVVLNSQGKRIMESIVETKATTIQQFFRLLKGHVEVTFEDGTQAAWLYDVIKPLVFKVIVCNPRHNKLLWAGNKGDLADAFRLAELLRAGLLKSVYHGEKTTRTLKELAAAYIRLVSDLVRVRNRIKAIYRGRAIPCAGRQVYYRSQRDAWLNKLLEPGAKARANLLFQQLDSLLQLKAQARRELAKESKCHKACLLLRTIPGIGTIRSALIVAVVSTPFRFRTKRQFWAYIGLAVVTKTSAEYEVIEGRVQRRRNKVATRGLNKNYNRTMKNVFKGAVESAIRDEPFKSCYQTLIECGIAPEIARIVIARKLAAIVLCVWKQEVEFDQKKLQGVAA